MDEKERSLQFKIDSFKLGNGLEVFLHRDNSLPIVAVNLWYHVGSKDETPDRTGLAHLFEHLMFEGSAGYDADYFRPLQEVGGTVNGSTSQDRTTYHEVVPSQYLELALCLEADRMGNLLPALSAAKLENQRRIVINERRQRVDNQPYGKAGEELLTLVYPEGHPYSWPVIGWMPHLEQMSMEDVTSFFRKHYTPANVTLAIVGDFEERQVRRWIDQYFGGIPDAPSNGKVRPETSPKIKGKLRRELQDAVALPRLDMIWNATTRFGVDEAPLDFAAEILAGSSKDARISRRLIRELRIANSIHASNDASFLAGKFGVRLYGMQGASLAQCEEVVLDEVKKLAASPPNNDEMTRVRRLLENQFYSGFATCLGHATLINHYRFYAGGVHSDSFRETFERYLRITPEEVSESVRKYLGDNLAILSVEPEQAKVRKAAAPDPDDARNVPRKHRHSANGAQLPQETPTRPFRLPAIERAVLSNGMKIAAVRWPKLPRVEIDLLFDSGSILEPTEKSGLSRLTADLIEEGTRRYDAVELARRFDLLGSNFGVHSGVETSSASLRSLRRSLEDSFGLFAEMIREPRLAEEDFLRERTRLIAGLAHRERQPGAMADDAIGAAVFGANHPYARNSEGNTSTVPEITLEDVASFYTNEIRPDRSTMLVVGDANIEEVIRFAERNFGDWSPSRPNRDVRATSVANGSATNIHRVPRDASQQTVLRFGRLGVSRSSPDYFPLLILNTILGGQFVSRLNLVLREEKGYTYGARSSFAMRRELGGFVAGADVGSAATLDAAHCIVREVLDIATERPVTAAEFEFAKAYLTRRFPARFETAAAIAAHLAQLAIYGLPDDYYDHYLENVNNVSLAEVQRAAATHLSRSGFHLVAVGDPSVLDSLKHLAAQFAD